jgi:hypothetical protein
VIVRSPSKATCHIVEAEPVASVGPWRTWRARDAVVPVVPWRARDQVARFIRR